MSNKQKKQILFGIFISLILFLPLIIYNEYRIGKKYVEKFERAFYSKEPKIVLIAHPGCIWCSYHEPNLKEFSEKFHFEYTYFDIAALTKKQLNKALDTLNTNTATPQTFLVQDGKVLSKLSGYQTERDLVAWLREYRFIEEDIPMLKYMNYEEYYEKIKSPEKKAIVIGKIGCEESNEAKKILNEIIKEYSVDIYYLNIYDYSYGFLKEEEREKFALTLKEIENLDTTPLFLVFENEKVIEHKLGLLTKQEYITLLKEHDFIK